MFRGVGRMTELVLAKGRGSWVETACGRRLLDMTCGIGVTNTGHCHPAVVRAAQQQAASLVHAQANIGYHGPALELMERLLAPGVLPCPRLDSLFLTTTGAEAVENAVKLARQATGRSHLICFEGGYHGRTLGTMALTTSSNVYKAGFGPFGPGVHVAPFPYELHGVEVAACLEAVRTMLRTHVAAEEVAAMVIEPVLGEGGYVPAPQPFMRGLRRICDEHGILLIVDEVQTGFGRTGRLFASEHHPEAPPDILVMAKGLASGFPLAAVASRKALSDLQPPGSMGGTYSGNAVACAAAVATLQVIEEEGLVQNAEAMGRRLWVGLRQLQGRHPDLIRDVRGPGAMVGVELCGTQSAKAVAAAALERDMLLLPCSIYETLRFIPPLTVSAEDVDAALERFEGALLGPHLR